MNVPSGRCATWLVFLWDHAVKHTWNHDPPPVGCSFNLAGKSLKILQTNLKMFQAGIETKPTISDNFKRPGSFKSAAPEDGRAPASF
jgi:hypothetical protein